MAKKKNNNKKNEIQQFDLDNSIDTGFNANFKSVVATVLGVIIVFAVFYLLTLHMTAKGEKKDVAVASVGYEKILAGSLFKTGEKEYLVVFYNREDDTDITSALSTYNTKHDVDAFYVDLKDGLNKGVIGNELNTEINDPSELKVVNPTVLKIKDKNIIESATGKESVIEYLNK